MHQAYGGASIEVARWLILGPAVNLVSRLEGLAKQLDRPLAPLGRFPLKGVALPQEVFAPDDGPRDS